MNFEDSLYVVFWFLEVIRNKVDNKHLQL